MNVAIIFAGGVGSRVSSSNGTPKQFLKINNIEIIVHTLKVFNESKDIDGIILVSKKEYIKHCEYLIKENTFNKVLKVIPGGNTGMLSIRNGIYYCKEILSLSDSTIVVIHDGVRPIIDEQLIAANIKKTMEFGNSVSITPCTETVAKVNGDVIEQIIDRSCCSTVKAPQCFYLQDLYFMHKDCEAKGVNNVIDSATLYLQYKKDLHFVFCKDNNIKITTDKDLTTCEYLIKNLIL